MHAKSTANRVGAAFIPAISSGFNDRAVRGGHGGRGRSFIDVPNSKKGDVFRSMIKDVALPLLDQSADRIMMVTSFNEWCEDTQIEATTGTTRATTRDDSPSGQHYTQGVEYSDYGTLYLDILKNCTELANQPSD